MSISLQDDSANVQRKLPSLCCISYQQLLDVDKQVLAAFGSSKYPTITMRDVVREIIVPRCRETGKSYAESINPNGLPIIDTFVTHSWDGSFAGFIDAIKGVYITRVKKPNLWICSFCLVQGDHKATSQQLPSIEESPFVQALKHASSFCVVRNSNTDLYSRIWCVCELMYAKKQGLFPDHTDVTGPKDAFSQLETSCLDAQATYLEDRDRILRVLLTEHRREDIDQIVQLFRTHDAPHVPAATAAAAAVQPKRPPATTLMPANPLFESIWPNIDSDLQDALALAGAAARREGKNYISTTQLFAALRRLAPATPLAEFFDRLPEGALPNSTHEAVAVEVQALEDISSLSPCVNAALENLSSRQQQQYQSSANSSTTTSPQMSHTTKTDHHIQQTAPATTSTTEVTHQRSKLSSKDVFVDIAMHGKSKSTKLLRTHGVDQAAVQSIVQQLGWQILERESNDNAAKGSSVGGDIVSSKRDHDGEDEGKPGRKLRRISQ